MTHKNVSLQTKKKLAEALKKKLNEKPFRKITVSELVAETKMNRKTFYYHFEDIYDLLKWMLEEEAIKIVKHFDMLVDSEEAIGFVMDFIEENEHMINCVYDSIGRDELQRFFFSDFHEIIFSIIDSEEKKRNVKLDPAYKEFLVQFYENAISGTLIDWIKNREGRDREKTINYLTNTIKCSLNAIFEKYSF